VATFLDRLAAASPGPSGGAAVAVVVASCAGLTAMVARHAGLADVVERAEQLRLRATALADDDVAAYGAVLAAERAGDTPARRRAFRQATEVPLQIVRTATGVAVLAAPLAVSGPVRLRGDACVAVTLASASARAATDLVAINTRAGGLAPGAVETATDWCDEAAAARARAVRQGEGP
jgi:formiminotetrahydrofolate cyclodeaminase